MKINIKHKAEIENDLAAVARSKRVSCDTETTGLNPYGDFSVRNEYPDRPFLFTFTCNETKATAKIRFSVNPFTRKVEYHKNLNEFAWLVSFFGNPEIEKIFHNANFDKNMIELAGIIIRGRIWDTLTMLHILKNNLFSYGLKPITKKLFDMPDDDQEDLKKDVMRARSKGKKLGYLLSKDLEGDYHLGNIELCDKYGIGDTNRTDRLFDNVFNEYEANPVYAAVVDMEHEVLEVFRQMMLRGHKTDHYQILTLKRYYQKIVDQQIQIKKDLGYESLNPNSPLQLKKVFYEELGFPVQYKVIKDKTTKQQKKSVTTDADALFKFSEKSPLAKCLVILGTAEHQLDSFIKPFETLSYYNRLHPNYNTNGPVTGRPSCSKPNLLNITSKDSPKKKTEEVDYTLRKIFVPDTDCLLYFFDYNQIELWLAAFFSKDELLMQALLKGWDRHSITAKALFGDRPDYDTNPKKYRKLGKIINFGIQYGAGARRVMEMIEGCTFDEASDILRVYWRTYHGLRKWSDNIIQEARETGCITNPFGRVYYFTDETAHNAPNCMIQGTNAEITKRAMINVNNLFRNWESPSDRKPALQLCIYDELGMEIPKECHSKFLMYSIIKEMQADFHTLKELNIPIPFPVNPSITSINWYEKTELDPTTLEPII